MEKLSWTVHRARETPAKTRVAAGILLLVIGFSFWRFGALLGVVAIVVLAAALHAYFLPITFTFDKDGVTVDKRVFSYKYPWDRFRRYFRTTGGVVLSPFSRRTFLDNFRGVHLLLPEDPAEVLAYLDRQFAPREGDHRLKLDDDPAAGDA